MLVGRSYSHAVESQWIDGVFSFPFPYDENLNGVSIQNKSLSSLMVKD